MPPLAPVLLRLAEATGPGGVDAVTGALAEALGPVAEYDAAELLLMDGERIRRFAVGPAGEPLVAADFLLHLLQSRGPMRADEPAELAMYTETAALLAARGMQSILAVPFATAGTAGALVLARRFSWSLVGVSLTTLVPIVAMTGIALHRSLSMSGEQLSAAAVAVPPPGGPAENPVVDRHPERRRRRRRA